MPGPFAEAAAIFSYAHVKHSNQVAAFWFVAYLSTATYMMSMAGESSITSEILSRAAEASGCLSAATLVGAVVNARISASSVASAAAQGRRVESPNLQPVLCYCR